MYNSIQEARKACKGCSVEYYVGGRRVNAAAYRQAAGVENIYRSGFTIVAKK